MTVCSMNKVINNLLLIVKKGKLEGFNPVICVRGFQPLLAVCIEVPQARVLKDEKMSGACGRS